MAWEYPYNVPLTARNIPTCDPVRLVEPRTHVLPALRPGLAGSLPTGPLQVKPTCKDLTDSAILTADPLDILQLYYSLTANKTRKEGWFDECSVYVPHPIFCRANPMMDKYPVSVPAGYGFREPYPSPQHYEYAFGEAGLALYERQKQFRILELRPDLKEIRQADGTVVPGLVQMENNPIQETNCKPTIAGIASMAVGAAVSALVPFSWPILIAELTMLGVGAARMIRDMERQKALMKTILGGAYAVAAERNLQMLVKAGRLTDRLTYDEAVRVPVTRRSWELALVLGLPHPAMICKRLEPCTVATVETGLVEAVNAVHRYYRLDLQRRMEDQLQSYPDWLQLEWGPVPDMAANFGDPVGTVTGIYPVMIERDGKTFLLPKPWWMKEWQLRDYQPTYCLESEPAIELDLATLAGLDAVKEWLAWRRNPELLMPDFIPLVKSHAVGIAAGNVEPAEIRVEPPPGLFGGKFDPPPSTPAAWLTEQGTPSANGSARLPAQPLPPAPVGPWNLAPGSSTIPVYGGAGGIQEASAFGGGGAVILLVAGVAAWFILNRE